MQGGYAHPLAREWQAPRQLTKSMFMYPIFITDDPQASVEIATLPGQRRWGVDRLEEFLGPLIQKGLKSVILFGVPFKCEKVCTRVNISLFPAIDPHDIRMGVGHPLTILQDPSYSPSENYAAPSPIFTLLLMSAFANIPPTDIAAS